MMLITWSNKILLKSLFTINSARAHGAGWIHYPWYLGNVFRYLGLRHPKIGLLMCTHLNTSSLRTKFKF